MPYFDVVFDAKLNASAGTVVAGDVLTLSSDGATYVKAVTANLTSGRFPSCIVVESFPGDNSVIVQFSGNCPASVTGLGVVAEASRVRLNTATGRLERYAGDPSPSDWDIGMAEPNGTTLMTFDGLKGGATSDDQREVTTSGVITVGDIVAQISGSIWVKATEANLAANATFPAAIVLSVVPGLDRAVIQSSGIVDATVTGLGTFATSEYVRLNADPIMVQMERLTVDPVSTDWLIGRAFPNGSALLAFSGVQGPSSGSSDIALREYVGQAPAQTLITASLANTSVTAISYDPYTGFVLVLAGDDIKHSMNQGTTFFAYASPGAGVKYAIAVDGLGNMVALGDSGNIFNGSTVGAGISALPGAAGSPATSGNHWVGYDPVNVVWYAFYYDGTSGVVYTSTNRSSWTLRSMMAPTLWQNACCITTAAGAGRFINLSVNSGGTVDVNYSSGGVSWSSATNVLASPLASLGNVIHDSVSGETYVTTYLDTGGMRTKIYRSVDGGITWSLIVSIGAPGNEKIAIKRIYRTHDLFIGFATIYNVGYGWVYAVDEGSGPLVWRMCGFWCELRDSVAGAANRNVCVHDSATIDFGGIMFLDVTGAPGVYKTLRYGLTGRVVS